MRYILMIPSHTHISITNMMKSLQWLPFKQINSYKPLIMICTCYIALYKYEYVYLTQILNKKLKIRSLNSCR